MMYGREFSRGHFNQHTGGQRIDAGRRRESWELDAFGWRDHSWGPRYWQAIWFYRLFIATFGPDRALMLLRNTLQDGSDEAGSAS